MHIIIILCDWYSMCKNGEIVTITTKFNYKILYRIKQHYLLKLQNLEQNLTLCTILAKKKALIPNKNQRPILFQIKFFLENIIGNPKKDYLSEYCEKDGNGEKEIRKKGKHGICRFTNPVTIKTNRDH